jgi:HAUS augmin-like complex subunit 1
MTSTAPPATPPYYSHGLNPPPPAMDHFHLTPQDLFSPSKARAFRVQAADWAQIDSWLSYKYAGRTVPTFERNDDTLKILRELSLRNEQADEERMTLERVERDACKELDEDAKTRHVQDEKILQTTEAHLTPDASASLDAMAATAVALNTPSASPETLAHTLIAHTSTSQTLTNSLAHLHTLQNYLDKQHSLLRTQLNELQSNPAFASPPALQRQATEQARQTKHTRTKIREYEDKLSSLQSSQGRNPVTPASKNVSSAEAIADMLEQQAALDVLRQKVESLEKEVASFAQLPADKEAARKEVAQLEVELDGMRRQRDALFEGLVRR